MPSLDLHAGLRLWNDLYALSDYPVVASVLRRATMTTAQRLDGYRHGTRSRVCC